MFPVSLNCPILITPLVFSNVYLHYMSDKVFFYVRLMIFLFICMLLITTIYKFLERSVDIEKFLRYEIYPYPTGVSFRCLVRIKYKPYNNDGL